MKKTIAIALVALSTVSATTALSAAAGNLRLQSGPLMLIPGGPVIAYQFRCGVVGPVEFPSGAQLWNGASFSTPAGLKVKWTLSPGGKSGIATLPSLAPGKGIMLNTGMVFAGMTCKTQML